MFRPKKAKTYLRKGLYGHLLSELLTAGYLFFFLFVKWTLLYSFSLFGMGTSLFIMIGFICLLGSIFVGLNAMVEILSSGKQLSIANVNLKSRVKYLTGFFLNGLYFILSVSVVISFVVLVSLHQISFPLAILLIGVLMLAKLACILISTYLMNSAYNDLEALDNEVLSSINAVLGIANPDPNGLISEVSMSEGVFQELDQAPPKPVRIGKTLEEETLDPGQMLLEMVSNWDGKNLQSYVSAAQHFTADVGSADYTAIQFSYINNPTFIVLMVLASTVMRLPDFQYDRSQFNSQVNLTVGYYPVINFINSFLVSGRNLSEPDSTSGVTPLIAAVVIGDYNLVESLIPHSNINHSDKSGRTAIDWVNFIFQENESLYHNVRAHLIRAGAVVDRFDFTGMTNQRYMQHGAVATLNCEKRISDDSFRDLDPGIKKSMIRMPHKQIVHKEMERIAKSREVRKIKLTGEGTWRIPYFLINTIKRNPSITAYDIKELNIPMEDSAKKLLNSAIERNKARIRKIGQWLKALRYLYDPFGRTVQAEDKDKTVFNFRALPAELKEPLVKKFMRGEMDHTATSWKRIQKLIGIAANKNTLPKKPYDGKARQVHFKGVISPLLESIAPVTSAPVTSRVTETAEEQGQRKNPIHLY